MGFRMVSVMMNLNDPERPFSYVALTTETYCCAEFTTNRAELNTVFDAVDKKRTGKITYQQFVSVLHNDQSVRIVFHNVLKFAIFLCIACGYNRIPIMIIICTLLFIRPNVATHRVVNKCKKLWFIHELTAHDTSKTAKITKLLLLNSTLPKCQCAVE